jgi:hypothetical protein
VSGLTPEQIEEITGLLQKAPPETAARLLRLFERVKMKGAQAIPAVDLLLAMRESGVAKQASVARLPGPDRLYFEPFDKLIESTGGQPLLPGGIDRAALAGAWTVVADRIIPDEVDEHEPHIRAAVLRGEMGVARYLAARLRSETLAALDEVADQGAIARLVGPELTGALRDCTVAFLQRLPDLLCAEHRARASLANPLNALGDVSDQTVESLVMLCRKLEDERPAAAAELMLLTMARLPRPWQAFRMPVRASHHVDDFKLSLTEFEVAGRRMLTLIARELESIEAAAGSRMGFDAAVTVEAVRQFGRLAQGFEHELPMGPVGPWRKELTSLKARAANRLETLCRASVPRLEAALPMDRTRVKGAGYRDLPRMGAPPPPEKVTTAASHLTFLCETRLHAGKAGYGAARDQSATAASRHLTLVSECLLDLRKNPDKGPHFQAWIDATRRLVQALEGEEAATLFARRAAA